MCQDFPKKNENTHETKITCLKDYEEVVYFKFLNSRIRNLDLRKSLKVERSFVNE